ncbi:MAG: NUDIX hydrolase [Solirubrobacteraceae bacterium]
MTPPSVALRRLVYRTGHRVLRVWWQVRAPRAHGVKCVVRHGHDVVFVRHTYGDREDWELPGGGIRRGEEPRDAAAREAREELGVDVADWRPLGSFQARGYGRVVTISCFEGRPATRALELDLGEIAEARWAPVWAPPQPLGKDVGAVLRRATAGW